MWGTIRVGRQVWVAGASAALLALGMAGAPVSALPITETIHTTQFGCEADVADTHLEVGAQFGAAGVLLGAAGRWVPRDGDEPAPLGVSDAATGTSTGSTFELQVRFVDLTETPIGLLSVEGTFAATGDPQTSDDRYRWGNSWVAMTDTTQWLVGSATVTGATGDLAELVETELRCSGFDQDRVVRGSHPSSMIYQMSAAASECRLGDDGLLSLQLGGDWGQVWLATGVDWATGEADLVAFGDFPVEEGAIEATLVVLEPPADPPQQVALELSVAGKADAHGMLRWSYPDAGLRVHRRFASYPLTGTVTLPGGGVVQVADCVLDRFTDVWHEDARG